MAVKDKNYSDVCDSDPSYYDLFGEIYDFNSISYACLFFELMMYFMLLMSAHVTFIILVFVFRVCF